MKIIVRSSVNSVKKKFFQFFPVFPRRLLADCQPSPFMSQVLTWLMCFAFISFLPFSTFIIPLSSPPHPHFSFLFVLPTNSYFFPSAMELKDSGERKRQRGGHCLVEERNVTESKEWFSLFLVQEQLIEIMWLWGLVDVKWNLISMRIVLAHLVIGEQSSRRWCPEGARSPGLDSGYYEVSNPSKQQEEEAWGKVGRDGESKRGM